MVLLFALINLIPIALFCWEPEVVSEIDNRMLAENPFSPELRNQDCDLTQAIENYVNDRIGLRDDMILSYTLLNDKLFGKMVHPIYRYGKEGYVFTQIGQRFVYDEYHQIFLDMVETLQNYCEARSIPFLLVLEPDKTSVYREYLPSDVRFDDSWIETFLGELDRRGIPYLDNTVTLLERKEAGDMVFNQKYDAVHWNDLGAYYGCNAALEALQVWFPGVHINTYDELEVSSTLQTTLPVSRFPIHELVPEITLPSQAINLGNEIAPEVARDPEFPRFGWFVNQQRLDEGAPKVLVFQGSHMNGFGLKYFENGLGEYICVHSYQNVINFPYYINIAQPDCLVFEVGFNAIADSHFSQTRMETLTVNPTLSSAESSAKERKNYDLDQNMLSVEKGNYLTKFTWAGRGGDEEYVWAMLGNEFDMQQNDNGAFEATVTNDVWAQYGQELEIVVQKGDVLQIYH